ncbi:MAG: DUF2490 domain-containing protein, partial [Bacteroidales bacterium]|nr:DUF2490 domain-containing protein [Bacteroidales bacterium]
MSQKQGRAGLLPSISYTHVLRNSWDYNVKLDSRHRLLQYQEGSPATMRHEYLLSDLTLLGGKKIGARTKFAAGFRLRMEPEATSYQSLQHFIFTTDAARFRLAHRISADQTFSHADSPELRLRYRAAIELPFNGEKADIGEFYLK